MPESTIQAFQDHGEPVSRLDAALHEAHELFAALAAAGIDYDDLTDTLEREGVEKLLRSRSRSSRTGFATRCRPWTPA